MLIAFIGLKFKCSNFLSNWFENCFVTLFADLFRYLRDPMTLLLMIAVLCSVN